MAYFCHSVQIMAHPQLLARTVHALTAQLVGAQQPDFAGLIAAWSDIVGQQWADRATPAAWRRRTGNEGLVTLDLAVPAGEALLVQHELPVLLKRINSYFGHKVVGDIRILQSAAADSPLPKWRPALKPLAIDGVADTDLAAALGRFGAAIAARKKA